MSKYYPLYEKLRSYEIKLTFEKIEEIINDGSISLMYSGLIFLAFASFLETNSPIKTETEIRSPYHLIVINPKFKKVSPGDCIKA